MRNISLVLALCSAAAWGCSGSSDPSTSDGELRDAIDAAGLTGHPGADLTPPDPAIVDLGRLLFFDKILSAKNDVACATCHHPDEATADGIRLPRGVGGSGIGPARERSHGQMVPRNAPAFWNASLFTTLFADGRVALVDPSDPSKGVVTPIGVMPDLRSPVDAVAFFPVITPEEMRGDGFPGKSDDEIRAALAGRIAAIPEYRSRFAEAFGDDAVTYPRIARAIGAFAKHLVLVDTPWAAYVRGEADTLSDAAKRGAAVFYEKAHCDSCHAGDLGTDLRFHALCLPQFGPGKGDGADGHDDYGRERVTSDDADRYHFKTLPLVNVALTAPYGHDGAYDALEGIIRQHVDPPAANAAYDDDGGALASAYASTLRDPAPVLAAGADPALHGLELSDEDVADLVEFLKAQTDPHTAEIGRELPTEVPSGLPVDR